MNLKKMKKKIKNILRENFPTESKPNVVIQIEEDTDYREFAKAVADQLKEGYGTHNFGPFIEALKKELGS